MAIKVIYKYKLNPLERTILDLPEDAKIVRLGRDADRDMCIWVELNPIARKITWRIAIVGTGMEYEDHWTYYATMIELPFVWHVLAYADKGD